MNFDVANRHASSKVASSGHFCSFKIPVKFLPNAVVSHQRQNESLDFYLEFFQSKELLRHLSKQSWQCPAHCFVPSTSALQLLWSLNKGGT